MTATVQWTGYVGYHVTLDLDKGKLTGEVYTFSQKDHVVVLRERTTEDRCNIHFVNSRKIRNYTVHNSDKRDQAFDLPPPVDRDVVANRVTKALQRFQSEKKGVKVNRNGIEIFEFLDKTHPDVRFMSTTVVCLGCRIEPPYTENDITGQDTSAVARLRKVISSFWRQKQSPREVSSPIEVDPSSYQRSKLANSPFQPAPSLSSFPSMP
ncbi:MAG: uncharacterized protein KVP18_000866 [Porospora cf. gigantea A]|uniref:uncharacterized protein n=1 Tax=Porospora cf. gigantea A TaxID=2853593 RepID=UPI003559786C|nr:MAG: hypothetical protein KVP18_000866 [Porospora cf. gigantea A]